MNKRDLIAIWIKRKRDLRDTVCYCWGLLVGAVTTQTDTSILSRCFWLALVSVVLIGWDFRRKRRAQRAVMQAYGIEVRS